MTFTQKETNLLQELRAEEKLCIEKYTKYSAEACDGTLKNLFSALGQVESGHENTLGQLLSGTVPQMGGGGSQPAASSSQSAQCEAQEKQRDKFLCSDALATEKHVSALYDTCIFEFKDPQVRNVLNHIQKEEQEHGEKLYSYMAQNNLYA